MLIYYVLTKECNLNCKHCIREYFVDESRFMTFDNAVSGIQKLDMYFTNGYDLVFSGGEPTIHACFDKILDFALKNSKAKNIIICTNGISRFFNTDILKYLKNKNILIQISIDGDQYCHDEIRGKGNFNCTMEKIKYLIDIDFNVTVASTVTLDNIESMFTLKETLLSFNLKKWRISNVLPYGWADISLCPSVEIWNKFVEDITSQDSGSMKIYCRKLYDFSLLDSLDDFQLDKTASIRKFEKLNNCGSGNRKLYVFPNMDVCGCTCVRDHVFGNLNRQDLTQILNSQNACLIRNYKLSADSPCHKCRYFKLCNGGCIGISKMYFGEIGWGDIRCPKFCNLMDK